MFKTSEDSRNTLIIRNESSILFSADVEVRTPEFLRGISVRSGKNKSFAIVKTDGENYVALDLTNGGDHGPAYYAGDPTTALLGLFGIQEMDCPAGEII